ncbi:RPA family protein [Salinilacihabitans rarus]|uniref:RPA family protein n=1 Tax=Salinilacihabitans rarus TaxID=2961596 RepID=UPI0020C895FE|nr:hypothetical protein [Salinilacihabitans rarus]
MSSNGERPGREVAYRLFAAEYDDASLSHAESDEERAPNYVITPTGARVNRLFAVGTLTEVTRVNDEMLRARVVDPTGAFVVYAGQYQPDELATLERLDPPAFVAVTGKARTFQPEDSDVVYTSIRPESVATVDGDTRDRWVVGAAERTVERVGAYAAAAELDASGEALTDALLEAGVDRSLARGIPLAQQHYGTTPAYLDGLRDLAVEAAEVVAGERDQVERFDRQPGDASPDAAGFAALADAAVASAATGAEVEATAADVGGEEPASESADASADAEADGETGASAAEASAGEPDAADGDGTEAEPATAEFDESTDVAAADDDLDELGDFESDGLSGDEEAAEGMYEMGDEERERIEEEFGAEFTTGSEVDEPGEADIDVPEPEETAADAEEADAEEPGTDDERETPDGEGAEPEGTAAGADADEAAAEGEDVDEGAETEGAGEPAADVDLQDYVVETMTDLDDGDGADRETVLETVAADLGVAEDEVEAAIQEALMGGRCFEPDDETLKAI